MTFKLATFSRHFWWATRFSKCLPACWETASAREWCSPFRAFSGQLRPARRIGSGISGKSSAAALTALLVLRFLHGAAEASTYPVAMNAVAIWFRPTTHALVNSVIFTGSTLGSAFAPPFVASMMSRYGWRTTFYAASVLPVLIAAAWWRQSAGRPVEPTAPKRATAPRPLREWVHLLGSRSIVVLCSSYLLYCYSISIFVYWLFKYLVDVRHSSIINSGWATSLPWITASIAVPVFGYVSVRASGRLGILRARRRIATICLVISALLMSVGATAHNVALALAAISLCVGLLFSTEASFWSTAIESAQKDAGAASGLTNLAGNLGGVLSTILVPVFVLHFGWLYALLSGSASAVAAAFLWFLISPGSDNQTLERHVV